MMLTTAAMGGAATRYGLIKVLVLSEDLDYLAQVLALREPPGVSYLAVTAPVDALAAIASGDIDIVICDASESATNGLEFLSVVRMCWPSLARLVVVSANHTLDAKTFPAAQAVLSKKCGARGLAGIVEALATCTITPTTTLRQDFTPATVSA